MEYASAIVDELGNIICWCSMFKTREEIENVLDEHPEWRIEQVLV